MWRCRIFSWLHQSADSIEKLGLIYFTLQKHNLPAGNFFVLLFRSHNHRAKQNGQCKTQLFHLQSKQKKLLVVKCFHLLQNLLQYLCDGRELVLSFIFSWVFLLSMILLIEHKNQKETDANSVTKQFKCSSSSFSSIFQLELTEEKMRWSGLQHIINTHIVCTIYARSFAERRSV